MFKRKQDTDSAQAGRRRVMEPAARSSVFSYHANRSARPVNITGRDTAQYQQEEAPKRSSRHWSKKTCAYMAGLAVLLVLGLINLQLGSTPKVVILGATPNRIFLQSDGVYQQAARKLFGSSILNGNKVTVDASRIAQQLHDQFPELAAVSVALPFVGSQPTIYLLPAVPQLVLQDTSGERYVLDSSGTALVNATVVPHQSAELGVPTVVDQSGLLIHAGQLALPSSSVAFITEVAGQLQAEHVAVTSYTLPAATSELDVRVVGEPYVVKFNLHGAAREETGTFLAVQQQLEQTHVVPSQYVDVMVSGRAYYL
jgi:hypothetical protein